MGEKAGAVVTEVRELTPARLTEILRSGGPEDPEGPEIRAAVVGIQPELLASTITSELWRLRLSWSEEREGGESRAPESLVLKIARAEGPRDLQRDLGSREVEFYASLCAGVCSPALVRCHEAVLDRSSGRFHLLMDDLSRSHARVERPLPASDRRTEQSVEALAWFHARWWNDPRLGDGVGSLPRQLADAAPQAEPAGRARAFMEHLHAVVPSARRALYVRVAEAWQPLWQKRGAHDLTLIHRDAHVGNFLYPRDEAADMACLVDWQSWCVSAGAVDLAYLMALHWFPERRARLERPLLQLYLRRLQAHGVAEYDWEALWRDYRLAVLGNLLIPAWQWQAEIPAAVWWPHLERAFLAVEDLGCMELVEELS